MNIKATQAIQCPYPHLYLQCCSGGLRYGVAPLCSLFSRPSLSCPSPRLHPPLFPCSSCYALLFLLQLLFFLLFLLVLPLFLFLLLILHFCRFSSTSSPPPPPTSSSFPPLHPLPPFVSSNIPSSFFSSFSSSIFPSLSSFACNTWPPTHSLTR